MVRVLFISHDSSLYGAQLSLLGLLARLDQNKISAIVAAPYAGPLNDAIEKLNIPVVIRENVNWIGSGEEVKKSRLQLARNILGGLRPRVKELAKIIEQHQIDVVYTNTLIPIEGALAARIARKPHIWHLREQVPGNGQLKSPIPTWLIPHVIGFLSNRIVVNSQYLCQAYSNTRTRNKIDIIHNGVDPASFSLDRKEATRSLRFELGLNDTAQLVAIIGTINPQKNQLLLAHAAAILTDRVPDVTFLIVGDGGKHYINQINRFSKANGIEERIRFLGWRQDIPRILAAAHALVVTSNEESFGRTVIEAMAAGTPVVSTRCGGPEEIVMHENTGLLIPKNDAPSLAKAIEYVLCNPTEASKMSIAGLKRLHQFFTLEAHARDVQSTVLNVIQNYPRTPKR